MGIHFDDKSIKISLWIIVAAIILIGVITSVLVVRFIKTVSEGKEIEELSEVDDFESASMDIGKSVNELSGEIEDENTNTIEKNTNDVIEEIVTSSNVNATTSINETDSNDSIDSEITTENSENEEDVQIKFEAPISGEIIRGFASDSLVYSETLEEWVTHNGVDIKADKTTVVKAATSGTVYSIKSDPRYGLTVIVNHANGYQTVYSNLLTAEYVVEGEEIETGQTIGTVGNSATFEIADEYHLHFELIKDGEYLDPTQYMNF